MTEQTTNRRPKFMAIAVAALLALLVGLFAAPDALAAHHHHHRRCPKPSRAHRHARCRVYHRAKVAHIALVARRTAKPAAARRGILRKPQVSQPSSPVSIPTATPAGTTGATVPTLPQTPVTTPSGPGATWSCGWGSFGGANVGGVPSACWRPFGDSSWLNTPLPASPRLLANSSQMVANLFSSAAHNGDGTVHAIYPMPGAGNDYYHPYYFSSSSNPLYTIHCTRNCNLDGHDLDGAQVGIPCGARQADASDHHLAVIDQAAGIEYDFFDVQTDLSSCQGGGLTVGVAGESPINGDPRGDCATAACVALTAGIIREQELAAGHIDHALFMVSHTCNGTAVYPADPNNTCSDNNPAAPAVGQWFKLNMTPDQVHALSNVTTWQKTILTALATYGMFVGDQGSNGAFELQSESPATYRGVANPWIAWAQAQQAQQGNNVSVSSGHVSLDFGAGLPASFWTAHLTAVDPCVIQRTC